MYVAVAGNIGVGKSSLTKVLAERYSLTPVYEAVDENPYLADFYQDMERYAFHSQMFFLSRRLEQHLSQVNNNQVNHVDGTNHNRVIQDRTIYEDAAIFAKNLADEGIFQTRDYQTYQHMYHAIEKALRPPDLMIYLKAEVSTLKQRILKRGRDYESLIKDDYLRQLNHLYNAWTADYRLSERLTIETDHLDFVHNPDDLKTILNQIERYGLTESMF